MTASDLRITTLDNGLTVATERVPGTRSVATGVWVGVGARDEPDELCGASHFLEHLLFKGTETRSAQDISRAVDLVGGDINAFTTKEYTAFYCRLPARHAAVASDILGDVLTRPALRADDLETERQVILEEIAMDDDDPDDVVHRVLAEEVFPVHPLGRDTAGFRETIEAIGVDDVRAFFERWYRAGSMVVSVAGPHDHDEMLAGVVRVFRDLPIGGERPARVAPGPTGSGRRVEDDTEQVHLAVGGRGLPRTDSGREALDVVNHVLGGGLSSRLFEEIREQRGLVYTVYSAVTSYADAGSWLVYAGSQPAHADEVAALVLGGIDRLRSGGITDDELAVAIGSLTGSFELGLEDTGSRMARTGSLLCTDGAVRTVEEQLERWAAVDHGAVRAVIDRVFVDPPVIVRLGPA